MHLTVQLLQLWAYSITSHPLSCHHNMSIGCCLRIAAIGCCHCIAKMDCCHCVMKMGMCCCQRVVIMSSCHCLVKWHLASRHAICGGCWPVQAEDLTGRRQHGPVRCALDQQGLSSAAGRPLWPNWPWPLLQVHQPPRHCLIVQ